MLQISLTAVDRLVKKKFMLHGNPGAFGGIIFFFLPPPIHKTSTSNSGHNKTVAFPGQPFFSSWKGFRFLSFFISAGLCLAD